MDTNSIQIPTDPHTPFAGGFFVGRILVAAMPYAVIVAPKAEGEHKAGKWNKTRKSVTGAESFFDGHANTLAMAEAGSPLAKWALDLRIGGFSDWYIPSRDEQELCYRRLNPNTRNGAYFRDGDNPSSVPVGYPYTETSPGQTLIEAFRRGESEAFEPAYYWASTQYAPDPVYAWMQVFGNGNQDYGNKVNVYWARAVRRLPL